MTPQDKWIRLTEEGPSEMTDFLVLPRGILYRTRVWGEEEIGVALCFVPNPTDDDDAESK